MNDFLPVQCRQTLHSMAVLMKQARLAQGLRQIDLSERAGASARTVRRLEAGQADGVALDDFLRILWVLGLSDRMFAGLRELLPPVSPSEADLGKKRVRLKTLKAEDF